SVEIDSVNTKQLDTVRAFRDEIRKNGLTDDYKTVDELKAKLLTHLGSLVLSILNDRPPANTAPRSPPPAGRGSPKASKARGGRAGRGHRGKASAARRAPTTKAPETSAKMTVRDSANWALIGDRFFQVDSVRQPDDRTVIVTLSSTDSTEHAALNSLR